jgi:hypothetical protein
MARRSASPVEMTMFPFLSVLCATIGVLMLFLIAVIVTRTFGAAKPLPVGPGAVEPKPPEPEVAAVEDAEYRRLSARIHDLAQRLGQRLDQRDQLQRSVVELQNLLASKEDAIELPPASGGENGGRVVHGPLASKTPVFPELDTTVRINKEPICVEVQAEGFVVHPEKKKYSVADLDRQGSPFVRFLQKVDETGNRKYLLLLIHPNGAATYTKLRKYLLKNMNKTIRKDVIPGFSWLEITISRIDLGVEPFSLDWLLINPKSSQKKPK